MTATPTAPYVCRAVKPHSIKALFAVNKAIFKNCFSPARVARGDKLNHGEYLEIASLSA
jgi:hypothetical protein